MGFSFRRSMKLGPMRLNFSTRGIGVSTGVRGARISMGPRGTYVTLGAGGFQYRVRLDGRRASRRSPSPLPYSPSSPLPASLAEPVPVGNIATASAEQLAALSPDEALAEIQRCTSRFNWFMLYAIATAISLLWWLAVSPLWLFLPITFMALLAGAAIYAWDRERRTAALFYDAADPEIAERLQMVEGVGSWLSRSNCLWHIYHAEGTSDWKHNAGASALIRRTPIRCQQGSLPRIELNVEAWCVPIGPQRLLLLPDRLLVAEGGRLAGIPYDQLEVRRLPSRFIETGFVPPDAPLLEHTWQYVNKNGGPDRRFANNRQIPVLGYAELELRSAHGLHIVLQTSSPASADGAAHALEALVACSTAGRQPHSPPSRREDRRIHLP